MRELARVFPTKTSMSPDDQDAYFGLPAPWTPDYKEVHISVTFSWDIGRAFLLQKHWRAKSKNVRLGGPAMTDIPGEFTPGLYLKQGITITSRGCNNHCPWCRVPAREGRLQELKIQPGNIIQDNNILACSKEHLRNVFAMLKSQKDICFKGGLEANRLTPEIAEQMRSLHIKELWLACDTDGALKPLTRAVRILQSAGFHRYQIYSYALIGDDMAKNETRLREIFRIGAMPFAQLYQPPGDQKKEYSDEWKKFAKQWCRPPATKAHMKKVENEPK